MNLKLLATSLVLFTVFFSYSSQQQLSVATRAAEPRRNGMAEIGMAHAMFEQNFGALRDLQEEHKNLSLTHAELKAFLLCEQNKSSRLTQELEKKDLLIEEGKSLLIQKIEGFAALTQKREQEYATLTQKREQEFRAEVKQAEDKHKQEFIDLHKSHNRQLFGTFVTTAATSVGVTWLLHKLKIL